MARLSAYFCQQTALRARPSPQDTVERSFASLNAKRELFFFSKFSTVLEFATIFLYVSIGRRRASEAGRGRYASLFASIIAAAVPGLLFLYREYRAKSLNKRLIVRY